MKFLTSAAPRHFKVLYNILKHFWSFSNGMKTFRTLENDGKKLNFGEYLH